MQHPPVKAVSKHECYITGTVCVCIPQTLSKQFLFCYLFGHILSQVLVRTQETEKHSSRFLFAPEVTVKEDEKTLCFTLICGLASPFLETMACASLCFLRLLLEHGINCIILQPRYGSGQEAFLKPYHADTPSSVQPHAHTNWANFRSTEAQRCLC